MAVTTVPTAGQATASHTGDRVGFGATLAAEWTKIRSVRSTVWSLLAMLVLTVGLGALIVKLAASQPEVAGSDLFPLLLSGLVFGQIAIVTLGVLVITSEYASGMIHTSLAAQPRRSALLVAKAVVFGLVTLVLGTVASLTAILLGKALVASAGMIVPLDGTALRIAAGGGLYLAVLGLFALGLGAILRHSAGAITLLLGLLFVPGIIAALLPASWQEPVNKFSPMNAGLAIVQQQATEMSLAPWTGLGVLSLYAAAALAGAFFFINKRDA